MVPFETLVELVGIATEPWDDWYRVAPPTPESVDRINRELDITLPCDYVRLAAACPTYGSWLAGIGEDFDHGCHILQLNAAFHAEDEPPALPRHFLLLNHGHDGDCDCWDTREKANADEHPIVYICLESDSQQSIGPRFESFRSYIEDFALRHASHSPNKARRRRAKRLIKQLGATRD
jgi:hypothetical protein